MQLCQRAGVICVRSSGAARAAGSPMICTGVNPDAAPGRAHLVPPFVQLARMEPGLTRQALHHSTRLQRRRDQQFLRRRTPSSLTFNRCDHLDMSLCHVTTPGNSHVTSHTLPLCKAAFTGRILFQGSRRGFKFVFSSSYAHIFIGLLYVERTIHFNPSLESAVCA